MAEKTENPKYNYKQFAALNGIGKHDLFYLQKKYPITIKMTEKQWCSLLEGVITINPKK